MPNPPATLLPKLVSQQKQWYVEVLATLTAMRNRLLYIILFLLLNTSAVFGQSKYENEFVSFDRVIRRFKESWRNPFSGQTSDSVTSFSLYKTKEFNVSISKEPIAFDTTHLIIKNPYYTDDFEDYDDNYINYPVSYSVIYDRTLISLFKNGKFVCHNLVDMTRNLDFERSLNTKKFKYHWIIDDKLTALAGSTTYIWDNNKWTKSKTQLPLKNQPKLFEDKEFIVFGDCHGEWGGTVYFFDKASKEIYFTESTCANSVLKKKGNYLVLAHLGHMMGSSEIKSISDPRNLTKVKQSEINKTKEGQALGYTDKSGAYQQLLDIFGIQLFSTFKYKERELYIIHLNEITFLVEFKGNEIEIVHPLFDNEIYTHNPVTSSYGDYTLMNLDFYGTALDKEVSVIIIDQNKITKVDWNENHSR
ncbi:hypothetical protein Q0590_35715 [Rhodocytophaga aerolata]|uniref:WG repeat-containing protein n=1 Tax=Rhodocytophaga aerolata TaxID=455078 RepID=A0ABT8RIX8_9BACT|nr:hypothetical protein [Rhodocytophaga aerolata]MDO1451676.1 hypothetical protein [Rhodocytophaga aerolata]